MREVIVFIVLAVISYSLHHLFKYLSKDDFIDSRETKGKITKVIMSDYGNTSYYISLITEQGDIVEAESIYYTSTGRKYMVDDSVDIEYVFGRTGDVLVRIIDEELITCRPAVVSATRNMFIASIVAIIIAMLFCIKMIISKIN